MKTEIKVNIHVFLRQFEKEYDFLYRNRDHVAGYDEAVEAFDSAIDSEAFSAFVGEFAKFRGDYITSDREAAAFMFALDALT